MGDGVLPRHVLEMLISYKHNMHQSWQIKKYVSFRY